MQLQGLALVFCYPALCHGGSTIRRRATSQIVTRLRPGSPPPPQLRLPVRTAGDGRPECAIATARMNYGKAPSDVLPSSPQKSTTSRRSAAYVA